MTSEIRANIIKNRVGLGTIEYSNTGPIISGVTTALNFKTGTSNLHNTGLNVQDLDVDGHTNLDHVNVSGTSTITGVLYPNNGFRVPNQVYSYFGSGNDLSIRHDESGGHHSYIFHHGAGVFKLASDTQMVLGETTNRNYIVMNPNSDVKLYFNNNQKLATSNTGIDVTGSVVADDLIVTGTSVVGDLKSTNNNYVLGLAGNNSSVKAYFGTDSSGNFKLATGSGVVERLQIDAGGGLQLGTRTATASKLTVYGANDAAAIFQGSGTGTGAANGFLVGNNGGTDGLLWNYENGNTKIATNNVERLRITSDGKLIKGHTSNIAQIRTQYQAQTQLYGSSNSTGLKIGTFSNDAYAGNLEFVKSRSATIGTNTLVQNNDALGAIYWGAADGSQYQPAAVIAANMDGSTGTNDIPTRLTFFTAADGANGPTERLRITSGGQIRIDQATSANNGIRMRPSGWNYDFRIGAVSSSGGSIWLGQNYEPTGGTRDNASYGTNYIQFTTGGTIHFGTGATNTNPTARMNISSEGYVTKPNMPVASFTDSRATDISNAVLTSSNFYNHQWWNNGNHFNTSNGRFTCPVAGVYRIYFRASEQDTTSTNVRLRKNGNTINEAYTKSGNHSVSSEIVLHCSANDYLEIQANRLKANAGTQHKQVTFQLLH